MSLCPPVKTLASTACDQCKKRKKSCSKAFPSCSRCSRFMVKCTCDDQVSSQALRVLNSIARKRGTIDVFVSTYFETFHRSLPIIGQDSFYSSLQNSSPTPHFSTLLLSMILISHLSSKISTIGEGNGKEDLYPTLKSIYSLLLSMGKISLELIQTGVIIAAYEHCQALHQDAWLSIGTCARMGQVLGLHHVIQQPVPKEKEERAGFETKRCLWWGVVALERVINVEFEHNKLPFASQAPSQHDILPLAPGDTKTSHPVSTDLVTPDNTGGGTELFNREFTRLGNFGSTIQATYLSSLVTDHITENKGYEMREAEARKLDAALQSFACTLIPPPGKADGRYCGAYGLRTLSAFALHLHSLAVSTQAGNTEGIARATIALQSLARTTIHMTKAGAIGRPLDFDAVAFWAHSICAQAALAHIKHGARDEEWGNDLQVVKTYLSWLAPRFKVYENYLREIEAAEKSSI